MPDLYLTPAAVGFLTQVILSLVISIYLLALIPKRRNWNAQTVLLTVFFIVAAIFVGLLFLDAALLPAPRLYVVFLENTVLGIVLVLLLQFAYRFPSRFAGRKIESYVVLGLSSAYALYEAQYAVYRYYDLLVNGMVNYRQANADYALALILLCVPVVFLRQSIAADPRPIRWPLKLWNPQGAGARGAREFALIYIILAVLGYVNILRAFSVVSTSFYNISLSIGILIALWLFASRYINFVPGGASILAKLSAITLTLFLAVMGTVGWMISPAYVNAYHPVITDYQTLRFTPNSSGGYDVVPVDFYFETELGDRLQVGFEDYNRSQKINFDFPFFGKTYSEIYVASSGMIVLGEVFYHPNLQSCCIRFPAILPLMIDLDAVKGGGVFARKESDRLIVTWDHLPAIYQPNEIFTFQAVLYQSGVFDITYNGLPAPILFNPDATPSANPWLRGVTPGRGEANDQGSVSDLSQPAQSGPSGIRQNFYLDFRHYLHHFMLPLAWLVLGVGLLLLLLLPSLLRTSITRPLSALFEGVRQMDSGDLNVEIAVHNQDDIGFLTNAFNKMVSKQNDLVTGLERRVSERTSELVAANERLRAEMESREAAQMQVLGQQRTLATLEERERLSRQLHDGFGQVMGYINVQTQAAQALLSSGRAEAARQGLDRVSQLAREAHTDIRNFILGLRVPEPSETLAAALEEFTREFGDQTGVRVGLSLPADGPLPRLAPAVEEQILHIIQEALTNVRKHASAAKAEVWFSFDDLHIQIIVSDDGIGFDPRGLAGGERQHFGLSMMRERAEVSGGRLEVRSAPGQGTKIVAHIPYFPMEPSVGSKNNLEGILGLRLLLVDDSPIFLEGLRNLLMARGLMVVGTAHDGLEAQEKARQLHPDVIVMDVMMPRCDGLEATRLIKAEFPEIKIVMLTVSEEDNHLFEAIQNGASGFLLKGMDANEFCTLLARLARGETPLTPGAASRLVSEFSHSRASTRTSDESLSERQWQILDLVARGLTYKEAALTLHLSEKTIKYHMAQILERLHLKNRTQAIAYARRLQER